MSNPVPGGLCTDDEANANANNDANRQFMTV